MADDKMRIIKCGWKNADNKMQMTKKIKIINKLINKLITDFPHFFFMYRLIREKERTFTTVLFSPSLLV